MMTIAMAQMIRMGARSRKRGREIPSTRYPATVNRERFCVSSMAKNKISKILENSPGWIENGPKFIQMRASTSAGCGHTSGRASRTRPAAPKI